MESPGSPQLPKLPTKEPQWGPSRPSPSPSPSHSGAPGKGKAAQAQQYTWAHAHAKYLPNEARKEAEVAILTAQDEAERHRAAALEALTARGVAERRAREAERAHDWKAADAEDSLRCLTQDYEEKLREMRRVMEEERAQHAVELREAAWQVQDAKAEAERRVEEERRRCAEATRGAEARMREAERTLEEVRQRCDDAIGKARATADARVKEAREAADERVKVHEAKMRQEAELLRREVMAAKQAMEEKIGMFLQQKADAIKEAKRRCEFNERGVQVWVTSKEAQLTKKEADLLEWGAVQKRDQEAFEAHHRKLLELEQGLHRKTMTRTLDRITRHLGFGETSEEDRGTPTKEVFAESPGPSPQW